MKSIKRPFDKLIEYNPCWSSYTCFTNVLDRGNYSKSTIYRWFDKLVDKGDYMSKDKASIKKYLASVYCKKFFNR